MKIKKIASPLLNYENKWVALSSDQKKVLVSGSSVAEVEKKLKRIDNKDAILAYIPPADRYLTP